MMSRLLLVALALALFAVPELAEACSVCGGGDNERVNDSYVNGTIFMSVLPLAVIGGGLFTLRHYLKKSGELD